MTAIATMRPARGRRPKASREGTRGKWGATVQQTVYGDFDAAVENAAAVEVAGGAIAEPRGAGDEARLIWQQRSKSDLGLAGWRLGRALSRPALDERDRSAQQWRMRLVRLTMCRS